MWDFFTALLGGKHCAWCTDKPDGWWAEAFDGAGPVVRRSFWLYMDFNFWLGIWKLGEEWHHRVHMKTKGPATWR